jgi:hypothetical protein
MDVLGSIIGGWQRKKELDFRYSRENDLMTRQHELNMERDTHRAQQQAIAQGTGSVIQSHFDNLLETTKNDNRLEQIGETGNQDRLTLKEGGKQDRRTFTHRGKQDRLTMADKDFYETGQKNLDSDNKIKQTREAGSQERRTITHTGKRNIKDMRTISSDLNANVQDTSTGISPLVAGPSSLQNIGPLLRDHPLLNGQSTKTPSEPSVGNPGGPDASGEATVTAPKVKKPRAPRVKKTGTYDDSYGGA